MRLRRRSAFAVTLLAAGLACRHTASPSESPLRFESSAVPPERSAVFPITVSTEARDVVVRGGFFVGEPGHVLRAQLVRLAPDAVRLDVRAVPGPPSVAASHFDYRATLAGASALDVTVVHSVYGRSTADTVFRGRVP